MKETNKEILEELMAEQEQAKNLRIRRYLVSKIESIPVFDRTFLDLPKELQPLRPPREVLEIIYNQLKEGLDLYNKYAMQRTDAERRLEGMIKKHTNLNFETNYWIGNRNFDFFFDSLGGEVEGEQGQRFKGLVIEVDGVIHDTTEKMGKDLTKQELLHSMGIGMLTVENLDVEGKQIAKLCENLKNVPRLDSRARGRVRRRVYMETILSRCDDDMLSFAFGCDFKGLTKEIKKQINSDGCLATEVDLVQPNGSLTTEEKEWLSSDQAASYLGITRATLLNLASQGKVKYYKFGRRNRYRTDDLKELLLAQPRGGSHGNQI